MGTTTAIILATILVIAATLIPTYLISKKQGTSEEDWAVASRSLPIYVVIGTQFASAMGGGILVGHVANSFNNGISTLIYGFLSCVVFFFIMIPAKWLRRNNFSTVPEILRSFSNQSKFVTVVAAIMTIVVPFGWVTSQITAFGNIYASLTGFDYKLLCLIFCVVSLLFVMPSGLKTVAWTDFIFSCFMIFMCIVSVLYVTKLSGGLSVVKQNVDPSLLTFSGSIENVGKVTVFLWIFSVLPGGLTNQLYFQRVCAADDEKSVNKSLAISAVLLMLAFGWSVYMGLNIRSLNPTIEGSAATGWFMTQLPLPLLAAFAALIFATLMSTVSSGVQSAVVNITRDIVPVIKPNMSEQETLKLSRILSLVTIMVALILCLFFSDTLKWLVTTYAFSAATLLCPIYVGYLARNKNFLTKEGIVASMIAGAIGCVVGMVLKTQINYTAIGIALSFIALFVVSAMTRKKEN
ncbi:sodium:solute symporter family protein [Anaerotignum sp.]|uniref:sodium:solute symporter family protein n=1 Tax=Anaerotignum sp. TaxID=2039241 RepID=UPI0028A10C33|nr:sodium:solute symporter family protein [Anaerotignum sp.]